MTLRQMLEHIEEAVSTTSGRTREHLDSDRMFYLAVLKLVEIVGEAAGRLSSSFQTSHPEIPWRQIVGARNRLVHGYDAVDRDVLWEIVTADFPALALALKPLL